MVLLRITFNKLISRFALIFFVLLTTSCISGKIASNDAISVKFSNDEDKVIFTIHNGSEEELIFPALRNHYLEIYSDSGWVRIPYVPCKCGTPCAESIPKKLMPGEKIMAYWDRISRKCKGRDEDATIYETGQFRLKITYQVLEGKYIKKTDSLWVEFSIS